MSRSDQLPIHELRPALIEALRDPGCRNLLIKAPTGSGKSTQVPKFVLDSGILGPEQRVYVLQPRRIAARMLGQRVAHERGGKLGGEVGYQVRFDNVSSKETRLMYVTEGVFLRLLMDDPDLKKAGCLIIDEFHERHIDGDLCLAWAHALQKTRRPDLKIIVMSATLVPGPLVDFLSPSQLFESQGRTFPVEVRYQAPGRSKTGEIEPVWDQAARACEDLLKQPGFDGDILVFMPGGHEIRKTIAALSGRSFARGIQILPLYGELPPEQQDAAVMPSQQRRIIVSTNVAETSLTIEGVRAVVDAGLSRVAAYDARRGINTLTVQRISRASAEQRAGRAGRLGPGIAVRLWPEREHLHRPESDLPEIHRLELSETVLATRVAASRAKLEIGWFEPPPKPSLDRAERLLHDLGAINHQQEITPLGARMAAFPLEPRFARMLLAAAELGCLEDAAVCAAIAQGRDILTATLKTSNRGNEDFWEKDDISEFQAQLRAFYRANELRFDPGPCRPLGIHAMAAREAARAADQFLRLARRIGLQNQREEADVTALAKTLLAAFSDHVGAETTPGSRVYNLTGGNRGHLKDPHIKAPRMLVAAEAIEIQGKALQVQLNNVTRIEEEWLRELYTDDFVTEKRAAYDSQQKRVINQEITRFRDLILIAKERGEPNENDAASLLADEVMAGRLKLEGWGERADQFIIRLNCLARWMPELELPPITDDDRRLLVEQICQGCIAYRQLKDKDVFPALHQWLSPMQRDLLDQHAPERIPLKNNRTAKVTYDDKQAPSISVVLQHLYDVNQNPVLAAGRIRVVVHLLSPAQRPIQTTADLCRFWKESYPAIRNQMKGRYPKHEWR
ncbi:MAG: ATP-dependent helicase HrpB [Verrucomicrobiaceae bacterium]|nr:ATP-dependent helicase HrpB [Verrucomicrobiaceae bacterium]